MLELLLRQRSISQALQKLVLGIRLPRTNYVVTLEKVVDEATSPICQTHTKEEGMMMLTAERTTCMCCGSG